MEQKVIITANPSDVNEWVGTGVWRVILVVPQHNASGGGFNALAPFCFVLEKNKNE